MRKRSHTRGVAIALAVKWAAVLAFAYLGAKVARYIAESNGVQSPLVAGPFAPYSLGWYVSQAGGFLIGVLAGCVCAHFAPPNTWRAPVLLSAAYFCLGAVSIPASAGWSLSAYWLLAGPVSLLLGAIAYKRVERARAA